MQRYIKGLLLSLCLLGFSISSFAEVNSQAAVMTFKQEIQNIKEGLASGKIKPVQAQILLSAIQARQNEVIIAQNAEIIANQQKLITKRGM